jgi:hypothetical protein
MKNKLSVNTIATFVLVAFFLVACNKYTTTSNTTTTSTSTGTGTGTTPAPLPILGGGGTTGTGGTSTINLPKTYVQGLYFTSLANAYVSNDSVSLNTNGSYSPLWAGNNTLKIKSGTGVSSDPVYTSNSYYLKTQGFYSYVVFKTPSTVVGETLIYNDLTAPATGKSGIRFISLDPLSASVPITFSYKNGLNTINSLNRTYLDHRSDTSKVAFNVIDAGINNISFIYRDSILVNFNYTLESGKLYTIFAGATSYNSNNKGTFPLNYYQVSQHN